MPRIGRNCVAVAIVVCAGPARAQSDREVLRQLHADRPLPYSLSCAPFVEYQQPLDEEGRHSSFLSDEQSGHEVSEATVAGTRIVPVPGAFIAGLRVWGLSVGNNTLANCFDDDAVPFNLRFYQDAGGLPGPQVGDAVPVVPVRVDTGIEFVFPNLTIQQFDFDLVPPVDNTSGAISWIGAQRQLGEPECLFHWIDETTPEFDDMAVWRSGIGGQPLEVLEVDMSICLSLAPIPVELQSFDVD